MWHDLISDNVRSFKIKSLLSIASLVTPAYHFHSYRHGYGTSSSRHLHYCWKTSDILPNGCSSDTIPHNIISKHCYRSVQTLWILRHGCPNKIHSPHVMDKLPLRQLCANFDDFTYEDFLARPFFVNLTHLEIFMFMGKTWDKKVEALVHLPNLTHLSIGFSIDDEVIPQLLRHCRLLRILILVPSSPRQYLERKGTEELLAEINDPRLVFLQLPPFPALVQDWVKGAHGGIDCWAFSELISLAKSRASLSSFMICDNLLMPLLDYTGNYFVDPPPRYFPRIGFDWEGCLNENGFEWFTGLHLHDPWPLIT
jgi:hypothetical protein